MFGLARSRSSQPTLAIWPPLALSLATAAMVFLALPLPSARADEPLRIAVAANFRSTMEALVDAYRDRHDSPPIILISGSTGKLSSQILAGAPFHLFFAADAEYPRLLEEKGHGMTNGRFTYALGILALWSPKRDLPDPPSPSAIAEFLSGRRLAFANPELAPYGRAAWQCLERLGSDANKPAKLIRGENVAQTFHFARSGAADLAFIALAQALSTEEPSSRYWEVPPNYHEPIEQHALVLSPSEAAVSFADFCRSDLARKLIARSGYRLP